MLRETLHLTNGNLNRHLEVLVDAGLLESTREEGKGRTRTWVTITPSGRAALDAEIAALRALIGAHD
ncbi:transcriptional regulator [Rhodococcus sp. DT1]|uniref:transcriptional regulator n=1 Tax=Rhodococcus sp. DT1 TaxID=3416544 RepID=UPI003CEF2B86